MNGLDLLIRSYETMREKGNFSHKALFRVDNSDRERTELIYEVSKKNLDLSLKKNEGIEINALLFAIKGVESVNLVCQNDEISR